MPKFFVEDQEIDEEKITIKGEDVNHIGKVLRKEIGHEIIVCNKNTNENYECKIEKIEKDFIECKIMKRFSSQTESNVQITIFQGLPKADKMELIIQKTTELGAYEIVPTIMKRCVVKIKPQEMAKKQERWQKIAEVAAKQCGRDRIPRVGSFQTVQNIVNQIVDYDLVLLAYEEEKICHLKQELIHLKETMDLKNQVIKIGIIIGPEGGIDGQEASLLQEKEAKVITLGKRILRTETVGFTMTSICMYELGDLG